MTGHEPPSGAPGPDPDGDRVDAEFDDTSPVGTPGWVKALAVVVAFAVVALFIVLHVTGTIGSGVHQ